MRLTRYDGGANGDLNIMTLTQNFSATIHVRIESDPAFREELVKEGTRVPPFGRRGYLQGDVARLCQHHDTVSGTW